MAFFFFDFFPSPSFFSSAGISSGRTRSSAPPGASAWYPSACVSACATASKAYSIGVPPVMSCRVLRIAEEGRERSRTCVAPRDLSSDSFFREAVVMIGEKFWSRASWMTASVDEHNMFQRWLSERECGFQ